MKICGMVFVALSSLFRFAGVADLTLHLAGDAKFSRMVKRVECEADAAKMGLPAGAFTVEYINDGGNSLAVVPVGGESIIFANVVSGSGARYVAKQYTWWDAAGRGITFSSDSLAGKMSVACHPAAR